MPEHDRKNLISMIARLRGCLYTVKHALEGLHTEEEAKSLRNEVETLLTMTRLDTLGDADLEDGQFARDWEQRTWLCGACLKPQQPTYHGLVCEQGHGGAPSFDASYPVLIHDNPGSSVESVRDDIDFGRLQELVGGHVTITDLGGEWALVVNEDAALQDLPINDLASILIRPIQPADVRGPAVYIRKEQLKEIL